MPKGRHFFPLLWQCSLFLPLSILPGYSLWKLRAACVLRLGLLREGEGVGLAHCLDAFFGALGPHCGCGLLGILSGKRRARRNRVAVVEYEDVKFWTCQHIICWMEGFLIQGAGASSPAVALRPCEFSAAT